MNAQRLLIDRATKNEVPALVEMTRNPSAMGRLHALWTLEGLGELKQEQIEQSLKDSEAGIRENAVQLAELHLKQSPGLAKALLALRNDPNAKVRFQLLLTLGFLDSPESDAGAKSNTFRRYQRQMGADRCFICFLIANSLIVESRSGQIPSKCSSLYIIGGATNNNGWCGRKTGRYSPTD